MCVDSCICFTKITKQIKMLLLPSIIFLLFICCLHSVNAKDIYVRKSKDSKLTQQYLSKQFNIYDAIIVNSIHEARDLLRQQQKIHSSGTTFVKLEGGQHYLKKAFNLNPSLDSGSSDSQIIYTSLETNAELIGGIKLPNEKFRLVNQYVGEHNLDLYAIDLFDAGLDLNQSILGNFKNPYPTKLAELFFKQETSKTYQTMVNGRFPNVPNDNIFEPWNWIGYEDIVNVNNNESYFDINDTISGNLLLKSCQGNKKCDTWIHGYFKFDWRDTYVLIDHVEKINNKTFRVFMDKKTPPQYPPTLGFRFYMLNSLAFVDSPGEYFINRNNGTLYVILPSTDNNIKSIDLILSTHDTIVSSSNVIDTLKYVSFQNLVFSISQGNGIQLKNADNIAIDNCTISNTVGSCVDLQGQDSNVTRSIIYGCGTFGVQLQGGSIKNLTSSGLRAIGNTVSNFSRLIRTYRPAIGFNGVGMYIANNSLSRAPHTAIQGGGNNNLFEYNSIVEASYECTDTGSFYIGRSWSQRGNVVRFNTFDKVRPLERLAQKSCSQNAFYLDDQMSGWEFYGNFIQNSTTGILLGGGRRNHIHDNYFLNNDKDIAFDNRGMKWQHAACLENCTGTICFKNELDSVNYKLPPYSTNYPNIVNIYDDFPCVPLGNIIEDNRYCHKKSPPSVVFIDQNDATINAWHSFISNNVEDCS